MTRSPRTREWWRLRVICEESKYCARRMLARLQGEASPHRIQLKWPKRPNRVDFLNALAHEGGLKSYLEIGCRTDECFSAIDAARKVGVDPVSGGTVRATSDDFFASNVETFDLIFIDGLHHAEQVLRDVRHSLRALNPGGVIVLHDCLPLFAAAQYRARSHTIWNGDVGRALVEVRTWPEVDAATCLIDQGLGIVINRPNSARLEPLPVPYRRLKFGTLVADYRRLLRAVDFEHGLLFARCAPTTGRSS